ncbi:MAG: class I SAM-dependent methyltransferase [Anaerolineae bacterium]|nr:class I SAM-dependent methyltransferase [Anaerolineae bacterium]
MNDDQHTPANDDRLYSEFYDPRLVAIYDTVCPIEEYRDFYVNLAASLGAASILDLGCGTGLLTYELATAGHRMIGVEPSALMLAVARQRLAGMEVQWIEGGVSAIHNVQANLAIMTGHVAQFFHEDDDWRQALDVFHAALRPGGHLVFESRNPLFQHWNQWTPEATYRTFAESPAGPFEYWSEVLSVTGDRVLTALHYRFTQSGAELVSVGELRFRTCDEIRQSLERAGFSVETIYGDWDRSLSNDDSPEMIFVARRR